MPGLYYVAYKGSVIMKKPKLNINLEVNRFGQLIQWKDGPEIVDGWKCVIKSRFTEALILFWANSIEFTIAKNEFKEL